MRVGLVSDTHGRYESALTVLFARCDRIIHAGDVEGHEILAMLNALAPVTAVRGNCDTGHHAAGLPERAVARFDGLPILVLHQLGAPEKPLLEARRAIAEASARIVVFGHTHEPAAKLVDGVLFVNPGSAGPRRSQLPKTAALLALEGGRARVEFFDLERDGTPAWGEPLEVPLTALAAPGA